MHLSNNVAIKVDGLGKKYKIGQIQTKHDTLRDAIMNRISSRSAKNGSNGKSESSEFWALKDVSFAIKPGEIVGIVGRNGAGKSTLLKTLARITEPSSGCIDIYGRVGSLLEVGTGFHPELSGRENVYLNGSILGMKKVEIDRHFEEIVEFAEVEKFIDTAVKHYSSGMYLRLAFGVAAFLQPEILLIDEVLAVGDAAFQKKCLGKMDDVSKQGRTVLFVSHNMSAIQELCQRGILIDEGRVRFDGYVTDCISQYYEVNTQYKASRLPARRRGTGLQILGIGIRGKKVPSIESGQDFCVSLTLESTGIANPAIILIIENISGQQIVHSRITSREIGVENLDGRYQFSISLPALWLVPGVYSLYFKLLVSSLNMRGSIQSDRLMLEVRGDVDATGRTLLGPKAEWGFNQIDRHTAENEGPVNAVRSIRNEQ